MDVMEDVCQQSIWKGPASKGDPWLFASSFSCRVWLLLAVFAVLFFRDRHWVHEPEVASILWSDLLAYAVSAFFDQCSQLYGLVDHVALQVVEVEFDRATVTGSRNLQPATD
ncbi:hypothetical protein [Chromobacterium paludis]|uniref:Uncharacterized protein n=1 Tax=Chromobacterium paludis TaxID=2605945 RepID=A0A5C1DD22_9NEIS|nr:hypothetical protein [Chromobacterium paludis]QEL54540.1 hypothetical protein FYK34_02625 [Chromobacterium paludis]